mmetsp:Transcript_2310/g.6753  ORF Transcript_2310/g.6753 Transcript_2310/m.6753 type:complete len:142 (+) Transcript_2310:288-713(+)
MVRFKNRYLLLEVLWKDGKVDTGIDKQEMLTALRLSMRENFGFHGLGSVLTSLQVKYFNPTTNLLILRCDRDQTRKVWCSATLLTQIQHRTMMMRLVHQGGTLKSCQEAAIKYNEEVLKSLSPAMLAQCGNATDEIMAIDL